MKKIGFYFLMMFGLIFSINAQVNENQAEENAANQDGLYVSLEPTYMGTYGNNEHIGDEFRFSITNEERVQSEKEAGFINKSYGTSYTPIVISMPRRPALLFEISYKKSLWRFGLRGWGVNNYSKLQGVVNTPEKVINEDGTTTYLVHGVHMFDNSIMPVENQLQESNRSPVWYWGNNELNIWTTEAFVSRQITNIFSVEAGLKIMNISNNLNLGQKQRAWIYYYGYEFDNHITLSQDSQVNYMIVGPSAGIKTNTKHFEWFIRQSVLFGKINYSGQWDDVDDIVLTYPGTDEVFSTWYYDGKFPFSQSTHDFVLNTELGLKYKESVDLNENTSFNLGIGVFVSTFWNAPVAPQWSIPGDWYWAEGSNWHLEKRNIAFIGGTISFEFIF